MDFLKLFRKKKEGARPCRIVFEKENTENTYITLEDGMKPRVKREDSLTDQEYQALTARWEEMLALAQEMIWQCYLNSQSEDLMPEVDSFPDIRYLTGNY